jgi:hypothetical protein
MFEHSEIVSVALAIPFALPIIVLARKVRLPLFIAAMLAALGATIFTVLEGIFWPVFCDMVEHACHGAAGVLLGVGTWRLILHPKSEPLAVTTEAEGAQAAPDGGADPPTEGGEV